MLRPWFRDIAVQCDSAGGDEEVVEIGVNAPTPASSCIARRPSFAGPTCRFIRHRAVQSELPFTCPDSPTEVRIEPCEARSLYPIVVSGQCAAAEMSALSEVAPPKRPAAGSQPRKQRPLPPGLIAAAAAYSGVPRASLAGTACRAANVLGQLHLPATTSSTTSAADSPRRFRTAPHTWNIMSSSPSSSTSRLPAAKPGFVPKSSAQELGEQEGSARPACPVQNSQLRRRFDPIFASPISRPGRVMVANNRGVGTNAGESGEPGRKERQQEKGQSKIAGANLEFGIEETPSNPLVQPDRLKSLVESKPRSLHGPYALVSTGVAWPSLPHSARAALSGRPPWQDYRNASFDYCCLL